MIHSFLGDKGTRLFLVLCGFFVANALVAEMIGVKLFQLESLLGITKADFTLLGQEHLSFVLSVGVLPWPIVFIMTDVINDHYGVRGVRFLTLLTAGLIAFALIVPSAQVVIPSPRIHSSVLPHEEHSEQSHPYLCARERADLPARAGRVR